MAIGSGDASDTARTARDIGRRRDRRSRGRLGALSRRFAAVGLLLSGWGCADATGSRDGRPFEVHEHSAVELLAALERGEVTSVQLVEGYLARIQAFDRSGPELRTLLHVHPGALEEAAAMDRERAEGQLRGPLHGIPVVLKDNLDTVDMPTTGGSIALEGTVPGADATVVERLRAAGALLLGKTNLHEFAFGYTSISSLGGQTRNPHDPTRNPGGSSGGTGAAVAASFAAFGYGTDTCGSVRVPASANGLFGIRPTRGLVSLAGVLPLALTQDAVGPLARSAADLALALEVIAGEDLRDPETARLGEVPGWSVSGVTAPATGLAGFRIGVLTPYFGGEPEDADVNEAVRRLLDAAGAAGADVREFHVPELGELVSGTSVITREFRRDLDAYLSGRPEGTRIRSLAEIVEGGLHAPEVAGVLAGALASTGVEAEAYFEALRRQDELREHLLERMTAEGVDVLAYPPMRRPPARIGEPQGGVNCQLAAATGMPALVVPGGVSADGLPVGLEFLGLPFSDRRLLELAYAWEAEGPSRFPPASTPPLSGVPPDS